MYVLQDVGDAHSHAHAVFVMLSLLPSSSRLLPRSLPALPSFRLLSRPSCFLSALVSGREVEAEAQPLPQAAQRQRRKAAERNAAKLQRRKAAEPQTRRATKTQSRKAAKPQSPKAAKRQSRRAAKPQNLQSRRAAEPQSPTESNLTQTCAQTPTCTQQREVLEQMHGKHSTCGLVAMTSA